jgi:hypothetical protein
MNVKKGRGFADDHDQRDERWDERSKYYPPARRRSNLPRQPTKQMSARQWLRQHDPRWELRRAEKSATDILARPWLRKD